MGQNSQLRPAAAVAVQPQVPPTTWHSRSAQRLWEQTTARCYSSEQKKELLNQAARMGTPLLDEAAPHETARAVEAAGGIRQAWKGLLAKPQFRRLMAEGHGPRPATEPSVHPVAQAKSAAEPTKRSAVGSATPTETPHTGGLRHELSSLAGCTGVAAPPPGWSGWQHERQQLPLSSPTFVVLTYVFPEDTVRVVHVSAKTERVAWSVPWHSVRAKRSRARTVSLLRKPDHAYMVGVDELQWDALQQARQRAKASEREYLAAQLHCDASMMMYPQRSLLSDVGSAAAGQHWRPIPPLHLPVAMTHASRSLVASASGMLGGVLSGSSAAQSLQLMREGSLASWYFQAMRTAAAERSDTAIASLMQMVESYDDSRPDSAGLSAQIMPLVPSLPVKNEWAPRSPRITSAKGWQCIVTRQR